MNSISFGMELYRLVEKYENKGMSRMEIVGVLEHMKASIFNEGFVKANEMHQKWNPEGNQDGN